MLFSIIIPIYNNEIALIERAVNSILSQTYSNYEIVIVNDCSSDQNVINYLNKLKELPKVQYIALEKNVGTSGARQIGMEKANGEYICFLDCDDFFSEKFLEEFALEISATEDIDVLMGGYKVIDDKQKTRHYYPSKEAARRENLERKDYLFYTTTAVWNRAYRKSFLERYHIYFSENCYTEDMIFIAQVNLYAKKMVYVDSCIYTNYYNMNSISRSRGFKQVGLDKMPFPDIEKLLLNDRINTLEQVHRSCMYGLLYEQIIILSCLMSRCSRKDEVRKIISISSECIRKIPELTRHVNFWNKQIRALGGDKKPLSIIERVVALATRLKCEKAILYAVNRLLRYVV